jgi:hypothetical protein
MFQAYTLGWDGQSHAVHIRRQGTWIPTCERDMEQAREAGADGPCVRVGSGAGTGGPLVQTEHAWHFPCTCGRA